MTSHFLPVSSISLFQLFFYPSSFLVAKIACPLCHSRAYSLSILWWLHWTYRGYLFQVIHFIWVKVVEWHQNCGWDIWGTVSQFITYKKGPVHRNIVEKGWKWWRGNVEAVERKEGQKKGDRLVSVIGKGGSQQ